MSVPVSLRDQLRSAYQVGPPDALVVFLEAALEAATDAEGWVDDIAYVTSPGRAFDLAGYALRPVHPNEPRFAYPGTPPEMHVFATSGVDGVHYGFLVCTPERDVRECPVVAWSPLEPERGVQWIASTVSAGLEALLAEYTPVRQRPASPPVPAGWRFEPSLDGVGVLAPTAAFAPVGTEVASGEPSGKRALRAGHPATALLTARDAMSQRRLSGQPLDEAAETAIEAYHALGRSSLAHRLALHVARFP